MDLQRVGVLGSGQVGRVLANGFIKHGYEVMIGSRTPAKLAEWKEQTGGKGQIGTFADTARFAGIVVLATLGRAAEHVLEMAGIENLSGKTVIDATNPISEEPPEAGVLTFFTDFSQSLMEKLQDLAPAARFVKAFSSVGNAFMVNPQFPDGKPTMFICGNDEAAKGKVAEILDTFGWEVEDMGTARAARAIEPLCMLWCIPGFLRNQWTHAFKLLKL